MAMSVVGLIDYGAGNITSVYNALKFVEATVKVITKYDDWNGVSHLVLPGVGTFGVAMRKLTERKLIEPLKEALLIKKKPFLGICVGFQILAERGYEDGIHEGLGAISGESRKIDTSKSFLPLPHIGWNDLSSMTENALFRGMDPNPAFYFVHSFHVRGGDKQDIIGTCEYGIPLTAAVQRENIFGVQFHPEKSQANGLALLRNFISL